ncbi:hypothetical protein KC19_VG216700 [Ceratodon purpureus]|uniref:Uncharacterized protein n=1 Tax=Ceratodon purpureus TaxID=3225 RepID=A0A8T0HTQ7_CERPU|nr:hypothetical protein KC19_VG216700 [Ceratodon purpureus]
MNAAVYIYDVAYFTVFKDMFPFTSVSDRFMPSILNLFISVVFFFHLIALLQYLPLLPSFRCFVFLFLPCYCCCLHSLRHFLDFWMDISLFQGHRAHSPRSQ